MYKQGFDNPLKYTKIAFFLSGIAINNPKHVKARTFNWFFYFNILWLQTDVVAEFYWLIEGIKLGKNLDELSLVAPCTTICLLYTVKMLNMYLYDEELASALPKLREIYPSNLEENCTESQIVKESMRFLEFTVLCPTIGSSLVTIIFSIIPLILMGYEYHSLGYTELKLPFLVKYFFDWDANLIIYGFVYLHHIWSTVIVSANLCAAETLFYAFCTHLDMHFKLLSHSLENVVCEFDDETRIELKKCIRRHQELVEIVNKMELIYSKSNLFNILSSSLLICLSGFNISIAEDSKAAHVAFVPFLTMSLSQIALMCFFGDMLMTSSTKISGAAYNCRWYDAAPDIKKTVLFILLRASKPCQVTAASFAEINLTTFTTILSRSWSYFALLRTMYD